MTGHGPLTEAETLQLQSALPSDERGLIPGTQLSKARIAFACGVAGVVALVVGAVL